ncbi:recombination protein NinB, partial [Escherichia coli]|nr:recombination protein NinB [Escherichia coli]
MKQTIFLRGKQQQQAAINAILATPLDKDKPV